MGAIAVPVVMTSLAVGLGSYVLISASYGSVTRLRVDQLRSRARELQASLSSRLLQPVLGLVNRGSRRLWPPSRLATTKAKLMQAGLGSTRSVERYLAVRITGMTAVPATVALFVAAGWSSSRVRLLLLGLLILIEVWGPRAWLDRRTGERRRAIREALPDVLDLLTISVEAGLGFEQALDRVVVAVPGPLSDEFARALGEVRAGSGRSAAMRALGDRTGVAEMRSFVLAIAQADTFGVSIGRILRAQSEGMRIGRRQAAQEQAQKAPIKMLVPMVFCVFPALFVVVLGPAVLNIRDAF